MMELRLIFVEIINIIFYFFDRIKLVIILWMEIYDGFLIKKC